MTVVHSFPPVARADARILVLGSMPGRDSLAAQQYYAHPRNVFWSIAGEVFGFDAGLPYADRTEALVAARVALWDVLASCSRHSSLDSDIVEASIVANDLAGFLDRHPDIRKVFFNGLKAAQSWRRYVEPGLPGSHGLTTVCLPSTSPAHASLSRDEKLARWGAAILPARGSQS